MAKEKYNIEKIIECFYSKGHSFFIGQDVFKILKGKLHKNEYNVYELFDNANKVVIYKKDIPLIKMFKVVVKDEIKHQDVLGTLYSLGIKDDLFGDVIKINGNYYIFIFPLIENYLKNNLVMINNKKVELLEVDLNTKDNFKQEYRDIQLIVSSLRIDNVISSLIKCSRSEVLLKFKNKEIFLNYDIESKPTRNLKENDIFSIRKYGKYEFSCILKRTKKDGYIIKILQFI